QRSKSTWSQAVSQDELQPPRCGKNRPAQPNTLARSQRRCSDAGAAVHCLATREIARRRLSTGWTFEKTCVRVIVRFALRESTSSPVSSYRRHSLRNGQKLYLVEISRANLRHHFPSQ